jgi:hypothetical protein
MIPLARFAGGCPEGAGIVTFRFLVASCSGDWNIAGPAFDMNSGSGGETRSGGTKNGP